MTAADQGRQVLIVDDAPAVAASLALVLSKEGFGIKVAHSAEDAITLIADWKPDVAFVDIMLPGSNGIEFSNVLKGMYPQCEISLMSGHPATVDLMENERQQGRELSVLPKPFEPDRFIAIARGMKSTGKEEQPRPD